jgi:hypothetical protein
MPELLISLCLLLLHLCSSTIAEWHARPMRSCPLIIESFDHDLLHKVAHVSAKFHGNKI